MRIKPENRFWIGIYGFTALIMLVAMGVFGWLAWTSRSEPGIGRVAGGRSPGIASSSLPDEEYALLAAFQAPAYIPEPGAPKAFKAAMALYDKEDYAGAAAALRMVTQTKPEFESAQFYLGLSLLLSGDRISGIQELRALTEGGKGNYLARARFYLAKGLIAEHDLRRAQAELKSLIEQHGDLERQAAALLKKNPTVVTILCESLMSDDSIGPDLPVAVRDGAPG